MAKLFEDLLNENGIDLHPVQDLAHAIATGKKVSGKSRDFLSFVMTGRSDSEVQWRAIGESLLADKIGSPVVWVGYEWVTFRVPGGTYTPDFMYIFENGSVAFVEIKGSKKQRGYTTTRQKLRATATLNPWFYFFEVVGRGMNWQIESIEPEERFVQNIIEVGGIN